jgi:DNA-binding MarR family transcriptional regulator
VNDRVARDEARPARARTSGPATAASVPAHPGDDFGVLLSLSYLAFVQELDEALASAGYPGFGRWFGHVLRSLDDRPVTLRELAERLDMTSPGAVKIVDAMEAEGYLERSGDPDDRRVRRIALTPRGRSALQAAREFHARFEADLADRLGPVRVRHTRAALRTIVDRGAATVPRLFRPL